MVPIQHGKPFIVMKLFKRQEYIAVSQSDMPESGILQQLVPVACLDVGIAVIKIIVQRIQKDILVFGKFIRQAVVPSMGIAEKNVSGIMVIVFYFCIFVSFQQSSVC